MLRITLTPQFTLGDKRDDDADRRSGAEIGMVRARRRWRVQLERASCLFAVGLILLAAVAAAQEPVINRGQPMTLTGEIVDISCYKQKGVAAGTGAAHVECAKACISTKGAALGILSDGDGLFRLWGPMTRDKYAKLLPYLGQTVVLTGAEVMLSNNYDVRSFEVQSIKAAKNQGR